MNKLILIIDDDPAVCLSLEVVLNAEGYDTISTTSGIEALELLTTHTPALILLDIMMPVMDGRDFLAKLAGLGLKGRYPIIIMTAMFGIDNDLRMLKEENSISEFLLKPLESNWIGKVALLVNDLDRLTKHREVVVEVTHDASND